MTMTRQKVNEIANKEARDMGYAHGQSAASWINTPRTAQEARNWLKMSDDGDPRFYDILPSPDPEEFNVDDIRPWGIADDMWEPSVAEMQQNYEDGFNLAINDRVTEMISVILKDVEILENDYPRDLVYKIGPKGGVAYTINDYVDHNNVLATMVGDDREEVIDAHNFIPISENDYCS